MQDPDDPDALAIHAVHDDVNPNQTRTMRRRQVGALLADLRVVGDLLQCSVKLVAIDQQLLRAPAAGGVPENIDEVLLRLWREQ